MTSVSSLFGLVNQLQSMEQSLTELLMEIVTKLGQLTETNVFLLVETQEGRKISGHNQLCQQYLRGALTPVGADFLFDVDASISAVRPVGCFDRGVDGNLVEMRKFEAENSSTQQQQQRSRKRQCASSGSLGEDPPKKRPNAAPLVGGESMGTNDAEVVVVKMENPHGNVVDDDDDDVVPLFDGGREFETLSSTNSDISVDAVNGGGGGNISFNQSIALSMNHHPDVNGADFLAIVNSKLAAQKMDALKCINGENAFTRGTVENRLSTSLCYDFGKTLADVKPFHLTESQSIKSFFNVHFERWIHLFVNLSPFYQKSVSNGRPEGGQTFTFMGLLRQCARTAFFQRVARNKKS